jgi:hypothetical protein
MGSDHEPESPAEQPAAHPAESPTTDPAEGAAPAAADGHSEQWRANASRAGDKIKGMFKS